MSTREGTKQPDIHTHFMEIHGFRGEWWLPSNPDDRQAGILQFDPEDGGELELIGAFDKHDAPPTQPWETDTIFGITTDSEPITLRDCLVGPPDNPMKAETVQSQTCRVQKLFLGGKLEADTTFHKLKFTTPHLERWGERSAIVNPPDNPIATDVTSIPPIVAQLDDAEITFQVAPEVDIDRHTGAEYRQTAFLTVNPEDSLTFDEFLHRYLKHLQHFLSLGLGEPLPAKEITAYRYKEEGKDQKIVVKFQRSNYTQPSESTHPNRINFTQSDIKFEPALQYWFESVKTAETLHDRYFSTEYTENMVIENQFLSLIIGLETYHRRINPDFRFMSKNLYKRVLEQTFNQMPDVAAKPRIRGLLKSGIGNEPSIKNRLIDIISEQENLLSEFMDVDETVRKARDIRHDLAHGLGEDFDFDILSTITYRLKVIVLINFLSLIGIEEDQIRKNIRRKYRDRI